ncbi:MAG: hypothetical protein V2J62_09880, partial [candidate division KSB1 bacterium]|nr:hypothetical protein [candidate division KSB1 bacterium]
MKTISKIMIGVLIFFISCEIGHGLKPIVYKIKGNVIFVRGNPPENTSRIEVFALKEFPPQDPQNFLYLGRSGPLDYNSGNRVGYEVMVSPTSYQLLGVVWKEQGQDW